ncbi:toprim domain-containing protein [Tabrizicola oligotrophica]|uniref:Virulence-associated protein E n=1 Tax=Tabrizicola oligotrophica TaxID=2710650 RepID=A0A6M0QUP4_9RHOB|nr:toprim domain-containing protein [Tabrizicola oligotrophica]NEY90363.1 virulence-associated protein E [Tabrizicola oligotrophica]
MSEAQELVRVLGGQWRGHHGNAPCPVCQPERRSDQRGLSIRSEGGHLLAYCHKTGCDFRDIVKAAGLPPEALRHDPAEARKADAQRKAYAAEQRAKARTLWASSAPIWGTKGEAYLRGRGVTCPLPPSLRWAADTFHGPSGRWLSAMVADVSTGGIHRTFFDKAGGRIAGNAKMMQGPCAGGAVALSEGPGPLVVCEGIETGLSLLSGLLDGPAAVWAALSTSGLRALHLPADLGALIIAADGDAPGREAATALAERAYALGWQVSLLPAPEGQDWNDVLRKGEAA